MIKMKKKKGPTLVAHKGLEESSGVGTAEVVIAKVGQPDEKVADKMFKFPVKVPDGTLMANIGVTLGYTHNLGNYSSAKVQVALHMPSKVDELEQTFEAVKDWTDSHMSGLIEEVLDSIKSKVA